jgi:hypothetical protein
MRLWWTMVVSGLLVLCAPRAGSAAESDEETWLAALTERVVEDLKAGRPLVVQVHAPLCDATIIPCGNAKLGDGDSLETNLYWSTTPGFGKWFSRRGGGWKKVMERRGEETGDGALLALLVYRRTMNASAAWRKRGAPKRFEVYVVICGWRGKAIDRALAAYAREVSGLDERVIALPESTELSDEPHREPLRAGGSAQLVAFSGHNRLMDVGAYEWPAPAKRPIGVIAVACLTADYMEERVPAATRVPLLMTRDFLFANAAPVEAIALSFARGGGYREMRLAAAEAYAGVQKKDVKRVFGAFTNPQDRRWAARARAGR